MMWELDDAKTTPLYSSHCSIPWIIDFYQINLWVRTLGRDAGTMVLWWLLLILTSGRSTFAPIDPNWSFTRINKWLCMPSHNRWGFFPLGTWVDTSFVIIFIKYDFNMLQNSWLLKRTDYLWHRHCSLCFTLPYSTRVGMPYSNDRVKLAASSCIW